MYLLCIFYLNVPFNGKVAAAPPLFGLWLRWDSMRDGTSGSLYGEVGVYLLQASSSFSGRLLGGTNGYGAGQGPLAGGRSASLPARRDQRPPPGLWQLRVWGLGLGIA